MPNAEKDVAPYEGLDTGSGAGVAEVVGQAPVIDRALLEAALATAALKCRKHSRFQGLRRPRNRCERCLAIYEYSYRTGVRETRTRRQNRQANA